MTQIKNNYAQWQAAIFQKAGLLPGTSRWQASPAPSDEDPIVSACMADLIRHGSPLHSRRQRQPNH